MNLQRLIKKLIKIDLQRCEKRLGIFQKQLEVLPRGSLIRRKSGSLSVAVRENGRRYQVVVGEDDEIADELRLKRHIIEGLPVLERHIEASRAYLQYCCMYDPLAWKVPEQYGEAADVDVFLEGDINAKTWKTGGWKQSASHPENLIHQTPGGVRMRSKSEVMIGSMLEQHGIEYHYEAVIKCGDHFYAPDFEMLPGHLRRLVYWEHLGMIDDPEYVMKNLAKLQDYAKAGLILGYNLFLTWETKEKPLTIAKIKEILNEILNMKD